MNALEMMMSNIKDDEVFTVWKVKIYYSIVFTKHFDTYITILLKSPLKFNIVSVEMMTN